jgi:DNA-binding LacI/PurR family transcriptional regulator/DNA-binding transcriptional regulator YhcF (GntR family)
VAQFRVFTACEQVAGYLREELMRGTWTGAMPGEDRLMARLGVGRNTIKAALRQLEEEGLLEGRGAGCQRRIVPPKKQRRTSLRIRILLYEGVDRSLADNAELLARLQEAGFAASFADKSLHDLGMDPARVARFVEKHPADAWVVSAGSHEVLEWFSQQPFPAIAMFGRFSKLPIAAASPRKIPAMLTGVGKLVALGHRRIVMLAREERRKPNPGLGEQTFLDELAARGLPTGAYNLPDWDETPAGFHTCLVALFRHTPPTALIIGDVPLFLPVQQFLARRGLRVPEQVSLFCLDPDPAYAWCNPVVSHVQWDYRPVVRRVLRWAENVAHGQDDRRQALFEAEFFEGGTIGPVGKP